MTPEPTTVRENTAIHDAAKLLARQRITGLPVVNPEGRLVGIVSESDIFTKRGETVSDIMSKSVISVSSETSVEIVVHMLTDHRIRRVPVVDGDRLVGIVSRADIIRMMVMYYYCEVCGEAIRGEQAPERCPKCGADGSMVHAMQAPGM
jgi:CBS domain-containing protein